MSPEHRETPAHSGRIVGLAAVVLLVLGIALPAPISPTQGTEIPTASAVDSVGPQSIPQNCSPTVLSSVTTTPGKAAVTPLEVLTFSAAAENGCGAPLAGRVSFSWWLSSGSLGTLNSTSGNTVAYTACVAPMGGILHVRVSSGAVTRYANSSISVSAQSSSGPYTPPPPDEFPGGVGSSSTAPVSWAGLGIIAALLVGAAVVLLAGRRPQR